MVGQDAVHLLGHGAVKRPEAGLDVGHGDVEFRGREGAGEGRVRVPVDEDHVRVPLLDHALDPDEHRARLLGMAPGADPEVMIGDRDLQLLEEDVRHPRVVVLARVDQHLVVPLPEPAREWCALDELRSRPDDRDHLHRVHPARPLRPIMIRCLYRGGIRLDPPGAGVGAAGSVG
ncbi:hypothetical protein DSECCO2_462840 [anaerobic digester metagenome]